MYTVIVPFDPPLVSSLRYLNQQPGVNGTNRAGASYSTYGRSVLCPGSPRTCLFTHTHGTQRHTGHADAQRHTDHTDEPHNHPNPPTTHTPHVSATTEAAAPDSTAAGPEPTAPRGRLRRGQEAAPSKPDPASTRSQSASPRLLESGRRNKGACGRLFTGKKTPGGATGKFLIHTQATRYAFLFRAKACKPTTIGSQPLRALRARQRGARGEIAVVILLTHVQW